ncbi:TIGR00266 family protein [Dehalobacterium formicoaceticum]|uniref:TIGR00266 family protein n=1 Tax=Dehalobacterium formicoaceticum TaxID=51515 RepID=A0ABT1Y163_9FIRM|nr:TIGR00266 family protein [Dehalobacterium formicoaceticum]MCR6544610.1 TIGR00266 family protein [Dehalobacterium formicoaceticum]
MSIFCSDCGFQNPDGSKFCQSCGNKLTPPALTFEPQPLSQPQPQGDSFQRPDGRASYTIEGHEMQFVEIDLEPGESIIAEAGAMMYMEQGIQMETIFGDGSGKEGKDLVGKLFSAGKRVLTGESLFMTMFTNHGQVSAKVSFSAPYPGKIIVLNLAEYGGQIICQKDSFLCAEKGTQIEIAFQKNIGVALFGGEGFIMQRLIGERNIFIHSGGTITKKELKPGETLRLDTGCLVAMTSTINYNIEFTNVKTAFFGGEGLALATLTGPGTVWLQSLPFNRIVGLVLSSMKGKKGSKDEGSLLGNIGIGDFFGGNK